MDHVRWLVDPEGVSLTRPVLVAAFTGWNDAGDAASTAVRTLIESSGARPLAEINPEHFTDFATVRPHVRLDAQKNLIQAEKLAAAISVLLLKLALRFLKFSLFLCLFIGPKVGYWFRVGLS